MDNITKEIEKIAEDLSVDRKRSIGEVSKELKVKSHVIRFWEENFPQIKPEIGNGGRRYYYNKQLKILRRVKRFLHEEGYTVAGLKKLLGKKNKEEFKAEKEQDLTILLNETPKDWSGEKAASEKDDSSNDQNNDDLLQKKNPNIAPGVKINPEFKLLDFANLEVPMVDLKVKENVNQILARMKENVDKLKNLVE